MKTGKKTIETLRRDVGISHGSMHTMLTLDMKLKKRCAKLIPHDLKDRDIQNRLQFCLELLNQHSRDPRCLNWVMTTDESWIHMWDPRSRMANREWLANDENRGQVVRREISVKKVMLIPFLTIRVWCIGRSLRINPSTSSFSRPCSSMSGNPCASEEPACGATSRST